MPFRRELGGEVPLQEAGESAHRLFLHLFPFPKLWKGALAMESCGLRLSLKCAGEAREPLLETRLVDHAVGALQFPSSHLFKACLVYIDATYSYIWI